MTPISSTVPIIRCGSGGATIGSTSSTRTSSEPTEGSGAPSLTIDAQEIAAHQLLQPRLAPSPLGEVGGEAAVAIHAVVLRDIRIDPDRLAGGRDAEPDPLALPIVEAL